MPRVICPTSGLIIVGFRNYLDEVFHTVEIAPTGVNRQKTAEIVKPSGLTVVGCVGFCETGDWEIGGRPRGVMKRTSTTR